MIAVAAAAVAGVALNRLRPAPADPPSPAPSAAQERSQFPTALPERAIVRKPRADVFAARSWARSFAPPQPAAQVATPPAPPPMPYKFVGHLIREGVVQHFLTKGDVVLPVKEGETLDGDYRVEAIAADEITLLYIPLGVRTRLALASPISSGGPGAQASAPAPYVVPSVPAPLASKAPDSSAPAAKPSALAPIASQAVDAAGTAASGTRAVHLLRERAQQLPPIIP